MGCVFFSAQTVRASHDDDGALDDPDHKNSLEQAIKDHWIPVFFHMTHQLSLAMIDQAVLIGPLFDAKEQLEAQLLMQGMNAEAHKDYHPDFQMCALGGNVRGLPAAEEKSRAVTRILDTALHQRISLSADGLAASGPDIDIAGRLEQYRKIYCDPSDNNANLGIICQSGAGKRYNNDIDFTRMIETRYTLDVDFTNTAARTPDEEDILALAHNLFTHRTFTPINKRHLAQEYSKDEYLDMRSIFAMSNVINNSFAHLVGMRAKGPANQVTAPFLKNLILETGVPPAQIDEFLGQNPSYFAQMEVLTKKMYESPEFFSNLYTKPANVRRIGVSLQAVKLMQDRDRFEASLRREMLVSLLLETKLREAQDRLTRDILEDTSPIFINQDE